jgi:hypothetical protein
MHGRPTPPDHLVMPHTGQIVYTSIWAAVVLLFAGYAAIQLVRRRDPLLAVLLVGGAVAYFNEPIDDLLGLVWHPRPGQWVAFDTFGPVPVWGVFVYMALFGGIPYLMLQAFRRGATAKQIWTWIGVFWLADIAVEIPALASGMYQYYGDPPMKVLGLPLYWFAINIGGPLETAVLLLVAGPFFAGWRKLLLLVIPMTLDAAGSVGIGWPIFSALHAETNVFVKYLAAFVSIAMAVALLAITIRFAANKSQAMADLGREQRQRPAVGSSVAG